MISCIKIRRVLVVSTFPDFRSEGRENLEPIAQVPSWAAAARGGSSLEGSEGQCWLNACEPPQLGSAPPGSLSDTPVFVSVTSGKMRVWHLRGPRFSGTTVPDVTPRRAATGLL